jgi:SAM-dependent methyltransferase
VQRTATHRIHHHIKRTLGPAWTTRLRCLAHNLGLPRWGNLRRLRPFSTCFGWDRGTPIDRYYVDRFFDRHKAFITGDVLEVQQNLYTRRYGQNLRTVHSFDIDSQWGATFLCDLAHSEHILPSNAYDSVLLPCTLSLLRELEPCLRNALRVLKPGGVLLANAAGLIPLDGADTDFWHCSPEGWRQLTHTVWPGCEIIVEGQGNCLAVVAANLGLAVEELTAEELDYNDEILPIVTNVFCRKPEK